MRKGILFLALCDALLAAYLAFLLLRPNPRTPDTNAAAPTTEHLAEAQPTRKTQPTAAAPKRLDWSLITLADLHPFVANLRGVGCPELTIKDIILAEVNRRYLPRERSLKLRYEDYDLWDAPPASAPKTLENQMQLAALYAEKKALFKDLLGVEIDLPFPKALVERSERKFELALADLPEHKRVQVRDIHEKYLADAQRLRSSTMDFLTPADVGALAKLKAERWQALSKALTPDELADLHMRNSSVASAARSRLAGEVSETEMRDVFKKVVAKYTDASAAPPETLVGTMSDLRNQMLSGEIAKEVIGEDRWNQIQQNRDPMYRALQQSGLPPESIQKVYAEQKAVQNDFTARMSNPNLTRQERQQLMQEFSEAMNKRMRAVIGDVLQQPAPPP
ncbi:MAG TPA: hypothetical protein VM680_09230 [Verrucomicrobiae bacterium]|nr:hypothetical protein [Verrucomicrobiae bacterium]